MFQSEIHKKNGVNLEKIIVWIICNIRNDNFLCKFVRTCGGNELGCSNSGSGVSDVQAIELIKPFTSMSKISGERNKN